MKTGYKMVVIWTVSSLLVLSFSIPAVMSVSNSFTANSTATENCKGYPCTAYQRSRLNPMGLKEYFKWFQESSMGSMKSIFNLDRITESWKVTSLSKISDIRLLWFSSMFRYFRSVVERRAFSAWIYLLACKIPRFCNYFDSECCRRL